MAVSAQFGFNETRHRLPDHHANPIVFPKSSNQPAITADVFKRYLGERLNLSPNHFLLFRNVVDIDDGAYLDRNVRILKERVELQENDVVPEFQLNCLVPFDGRDCVERYVDFGVTRCADRAHCPDEVEITGMSGKLAKIPFSPETTVAQLKELIQKTLQDQGTELSSNQLHLIFNRARLGNNAATLGALGVSHNDRIKLL